MRAYLWTSPCYGHFLDGADDPAESEEDRLLREARETYLRYTEDGTFIPEDEPEAALGTHTPKASSPAAGAPVAPALPQVTEDVRRAISALALLPIDPAMAEAHDRVVYQNERACITVGDIHAARRAATWMSPEAERGIQPDIVAVDRFAGTRKPTAPVGEAKPRSERAAAPDARASILHDDVASPR